MNNIKKKNNDKEYILRVIKYIKPYKVKFFLAILCIMSSIGFGIIGPLFWGRTVTSLFTKSLHNSLKYIILSMTFGVCQYSCHFSFFILKTMRLPPHHPHFLCLPFFPGSGKPFLSMSSL